jgi:hypothetical protein
MGLTPLLPWTGCVDTSFVPASGWAMDENVVVGEFGDELEISYSPAQPIDGVFVDFRYSGSLKGSFLVRRLCCFLQRGGTVWLSCKEHKEWTFETISDLMLKDAIARNVKKLNKLKEKIALLQVPLIDVGHGFNFDSTHTTTPHRTFSSKAPSIRARASRTS